MTKRETWELLKKHMPELAAEMMKHPGFIKSVGITVT